MTPYAQAAAAVSGKTLAPAEHHCTANGCPMPGTLASSTNGASEWYCQWHFGQSYGEYGAITARINNRVGLIRRALQMCNESPAEPIARQADEIKRFYAAAGRADLLKLPKTKPMTLRTLSAHILGELGSEISQPQPRVDDTPTAQPENWTDTKALVKSALAGLRRPEAFDELAEA